MFPWDRLPRCALTPSTFPDYSQRGESGNQPTGQLLGYHTSYFLSVAPSVAQKKGHFALTMCPKTPKGRRQGLTSCAPFLIHKEESEAGIQGRGGAQALVPPVNHVHVHQ